MELYHTPITRTEVAHQTLNVLLDDIQISNPVSSEYRSDHLTGLLPLFLVRGEYAVTQKGVPLFVELGSLSKTLELGRLSI